MTPAQMPIGAVFLAQSGSTWGIWVRDEYNLSLLVSSKHGGDSGITTYLGPSWGHCCTVLSDEHADAIRMLIALEPKPQAAIVMMLTMQGILR